ncbi:sterile alpha motif domain-containing protein 9 [Colossoma macropomum]|uniref:sterile alpha motif domain-containing protein 9 n=1 Tax=Colossoma macropomum TaxID=42526 RepID=UPI001864E632|nr:sterile alpha motif domain-containing protein 9 [Colossoma macropomum]XP_036412006.1 sterile alpha motif domain-containing protein 9 [Colossoma macropomum]
MLIFETRMTQKMEFPRRVEEWTKEQVHQWLSEELKVDQTWADKLYEEEVSGKELVCYKPRDLCELGIKHGPAVRIINTLEDLVKSQENKSGTDISQTQSHSESPRCSRIKHTETKPDTSSMKTAVSKNQKKSQKKKNKGTMQKDLSNPDTCTTSAHRSSANEASSRNTTIQTRELQVEETLCNITKTQTTEMCTTMTSQGAKNKEESKANVPSSNVPAQVPETYPTAESRDDFKIKVSNAGKVSGMKMDEKKQGKSKHLCSFYPFDQQSVSHRYIENYILPPESGPSNLVDPVHEYKFLGRAEDIDIMKKKINKEVFRFAAGCLNRRTNGTIHFGVADSKDSTYCHGEIVGVSVNENDVIIDHFNQGINRYFEDKADDAKRCIRQPRFVEVLSSDSTSSSKYVIEVDVVPSYSIVHGKIYYTQTLDEDNEWRKSKGKSLFIRDGAATRDICKIGNPRDLQVELAKVNTDLNVLDTLRKEAEKKPESKRKLNQGEKLKNLLTCGGGTLDHYDYYIIVMNKSHSDQLQNLKFLTAWKLFCVLDFDPDSVKNGSCHSYRKNRIANLHSPGQFHGDPGSLIQKLNLYQQTSWVFCNGRVDIDKESDKPLPPSEWLIHRAGEVQDMISFLCHPDTLPRGRFLVIFLLLSVVEGMNDPIFDTFMSFYKNLGGTQNIISICTSDSAFQKWKDFIQIRTELDINGQSIYELELSEINGTILEQHNQTKDRLLPSVDRSSVVLTQIDEDSMPALEILCQNQCENVYDEESEEFVNFRIKTEAEFYRGDKVKWWNFYFSDKTPTKPFIQRDKYTHVKNMIRSQTNEPTSTCVMVNLFHHPGCGGTTLAMHVMWDLRKEFRCAVLRDNTISKTEVAQQVNYLIKCGKTERSRKTPVLLLVEDSEETENTQELQHCLRKIIGEMDAFVVILNCVRSKSPKEKHKTSVTDSQYITAALSKDEQNAFEVKLKELQEIHDKPENFYSFMIMKSNFNQEYVANVAYNILRDVDVGSREAQLLSILALLNTYVADSSISASLCEDFLGIKRTPHWKEFVMNKMEPYSCLLIEFQVEEYGVYKAIRFVHQRIAAECVKVLEERHNSPRADIILNMLHTDLFFERGIGKDNLLQSLKSMLITRQRKTEGDEKDTLFSPLIEDIKSGNDGPRKIQHILTEASKRLYKDFTIPQALARHYYLNERNFDLAKEWANNAKTIKENSYTVDTVGQVSRNELKHKMDSKKQKLYTSDDLQEFLELAKAAIKAFQRAQILAKTDDNADIEERRHWKQNTYNISGYMSEIDIAMTVFDIVRRLPLFPEKDAMKNEYIKQFFEGKMPLSSIPIAQTDANQKLVAILKDYEQFLISLKSCVDKAFEFLEVFFTYTREKGVVDKERQNKNRNWIFDHYKNYTSLFCSSSEEKLSKPKLSLNMEIEECRMFLKENRANYFPRILQLLEVRKEMIEPIAEKHSFIYQNCNDKSLQDKANHLLTHIILKLIQPKSKVAKSEKELTDLLKEILQEAGLSHQYPEPYYLALLLLWPGKKQPDKQIATYVEKIRNASQKQHSPILRNRASIAHLYLGKSDGLDRLVSKTVLDGCFSDISRRNIVWQSGDIFKEKAIKEKLLRVNGIIEQRHLYAEYGKLQIPVRPAYLGGIRSGHSTEKVSFYVGFAIDGPLAYDIQYEDS